MQGVRLNGSAVYYRQPVLRKLIVHVRRAATGTRLSINELEYAYQRKRQQHLKAELFSAFSFFAS